MRVAIFSDVHGNPYACRAVLQAIEQEGTLDRIIAAGDLCLNGSDPAGCVDMLRQAGVEAVYGNTDQYLFAPDQEPGDELHLRKWAAILEDVHWALPRLGQERVAWLAGLPFEIRIRPDEHADQELLVVHANPIDLEIMILPPAAEQIELFGQIRQDDRDPELSGVLKHLDAAVLAFGHLHYANDRIWHEKRLINIASASLPAYGPDPYARYTLFEWQEESWQITRRRVIYDYAQEIEALNRSEMPGRDAAIRTFSASSRIS